MVNEHLSNKINSLFTNKKGNEYDLLIQIYIDSRGETMKHISREHVIRGFIKEHDLLILEDSDISTSLYNETVRLDIFMGMIESCAQEIYIRQEDNNYPNISYIEKDLPTLLTKFKASCRKRNIKIKTENSIKFIKED